MGILFQIDAFCQTRIQDLVLALLWRHIDVPNVFRVDINHAKDDIADCRVVRSAGSILLSPFIRNVRFCWHAVSGDMFISVRRGNKNL